MIDETSSAGMALARGPLIARRLGGWALKGGFSILDQGLFSAANFGLSVVLARLISQTDYGVFAIDLNIFLIVAGVHNALLVEPMSVFGPARHTGSLETYIGNLVWLHVGLTGVMAVLGVAVGALLPGRLGTALLGMSISLPPLLLFWLLRRAHYLETHPAEAATSSALYVVTLSLTAAILWNVHLLNGATSFLAMGLAGLTASLFSLVRLRVTLPRFSPADLRALARENLEFGRWVIPSIVFYPLLSQIQIFYTGWLLGLGSAGALRALQNPILPFVQIVTALSTLSIPVLSRTFAGSGPQRAYRLGLIYTGLLTLLALVFEAALMSTGNLWDRVLYGGKYAGYDWLMPILGLFAVVGAAAAGFATMFRAMQRPELMMVVYAIGGTFGAGASYLFILEWRLPGAIYALVAAQAVTAVAGFVAITRVGAAQSRFGIAR